MNPTILTAEKLAAVIQGKIEGNANVTISGVSKIEDAGVGDMAFLSNPKYLHYIYETKASIVIVNDSLVIDKEVGATLIRVPNSYVGFCILLDTFFNPNIHPQGIDNQAYVSDSAKVGNDVYFGPFVVVEEGAEIGDNVKIYPNCYVGKNAKIGNNSILYSGVKVYPFCELGSNCIIHSGTVIGSDGFGFAPLPNGTYAKIPQIGNVIIEDNVEIGSNCSIDRATMGSTFIRTGVKLDNLIQVAHNAEIGAHTVIASQTGVSGSTKIGQNCVIGGQVGFVGHVTIANGTQIGAQSGVSKAITEESQQWFGSPAIPLKEALKVQVLLKNLPDMQRRIIELEKTISDIKNK